MTTLEHKEKLWRTTEIHDNLIDVSKIFDDQTKQAFKTQSKFIPKGWCEHLARTRNQNRYRKAIKLI